MEPVRLLPGQQELRGGARPHRQRRPERDRVAQADRPLGGGNADAVVALATVQLRGFPGVVPQGREHGPGRGQQPVLAGGRGELAEARTEDEAALHVTGHQMVVLERHREAVRGGAGQSRRLHELGEGGRAGLEGAEHVGGLVEHADAASVLLRGVVHAPILPSY